MLIDLTNHPERLDVDLCIIGGGPAGICMANEYAGLGHSVALLEGGFLDADPSTQLLNLGWSRGPIVENHPFYLAASRRRLFGGSQMLWGGWCTTLAELDLESREWVPDSGWPISMTELLPYYDRAAGITGLHPSAARPVPERPAIGDGLVERHYYFAPRRRTIRETFQQRLADSENVTVCLGFNVTSFAGGQSRRRIQTIQARALNGAQLSVTAKYFVLAAGGIENARLLLANGLGNDNDVAGRYFMEHPHVVLGSVRLPDRARWEKYLEHMDPQLGHGAMLGLGLSAETQRQCRLLNAAVQLWPEDAPIDSSDDLFHARLVLRAEQRPKRESRVTLGADRDPLGVPVAQLDWELDPMDWSSICVTARLIASSLTQHAGADVDLAIRDDSPWPEFPANGESYHPWGCHHMGTTRMSEDPRDGVVDPDTRVHGLENLFVAGSSVFPTGGYANPTFTLIALALRTADHIKILMESEDSCPPLAQLVEDTPFIPV